MLAHHPYSVGQPRRKALNADDVSIPDIGKLTRLLRTAERSGRALPRKRHPVWVTETSYDSRPPDPDGVPAATHARWLQEAFFLLWRQGVDTITWFQVRDQLPGAELRRHQPVGRLLRRRARQARRPRLPLPARRRARRRARATACGAAARSPAASGSSGGPATRWRTVRTVQAKRGGTFLLRIARKSAGERLRARVGTETSLTWLAR